jgi:hypothetical protein
MVQVWRIANPEQRERVQNLLFDGGLGYSQKSGLFNPSKSSIFNAMESVGFEKVSLAEAAGVEPDIGVENAQLIDSGNA